jgi:hypothetical protein
MRTFGEFPKNIPKYRYILILQPAKIIFSWILCRKSVIKHVAWKSLGTSHTNES